MRQPDSATRSQSILELGELGIKIGDLEAEWLTLSEELESLKQKE